MTKTVTKPLFASIWPLLLRIQSLKRYSQKSHWLKYRHNER